MRPNLRSAALGFLAVASPALLAASLLPGWAAAWGFALVGGAFPVALMALGAVRPALDRSGARRPGALGWVLLGLLLVLEGTAAGVLIFSGSPGGGLGALRLAGLPLATVIQVVGLWLLPLSLAALGYALTFDRSGVSSEDLARLRRRAGRVGEGPRERGVIQ